VEHEPDIRVRCPVCDMFYGLYDHAPERVFWHLNTCQMQTYIHVRPPRVNCPTHGVKQIGVNGNLKVYQFR
jgi:transposase